MGEDGRRTVVLAVPPGERCLGFAQAFAEASFAPMLVFDAGQLWALVSNVEFTIVVVHECIDGDERAIDAIVDSDIVVVLLGDSPRVASRRVHAVLPTTVAPVELVLRASALLELALERTRQGVYDWGELRVDAMRRVATFAGERLRLSPVQFRMLLTLVKARGAVVTKSDLQRSAWPRARLDDGERVLAHVRRIRARLSEYGGSRFLLTVRGEGFRLEDPATPWDGVERRRGERRAS